MNQPPNKTFDPQTLASDLCEVQEIYARFFAGIRDEDWDKPVKGSPQEWDLHHTVAHLCALTGAGLESIQSTLLNEPYVFAGLENRFQFIDYNLRGIHDHLDLPKIQLCAEFLDILDQTASIARSLTPAQAELASTMPIYNRPVKIVEAMGIMMFHAGLHHTSQVAEPAGVPPLWTQLSPETRHRVIGRVMRALSLLYRFDLGGDLRAAIVFHVDGPGGGTWHVKISPESTSSYESDIQHPNRLFIHLRATDVFCRMFTGRFNLPIALLSGQMRLRGNLRLFPRMTSLFSVDAK